MPSYKVRLGDGTFLVVDFDGLTAWLADEGAMVQVIGSQRWCPLKQYVAEERAAASQASRQRSTARDALPLAYPKPQEDESPRVSVGEPPGVQLLADEPVAPPAEEERTRLTADDPRPISRPKPLVAGVGFDDEDRIGEVRLRSRLTQTLLRVASRFGTFLSRCLDPVNRLERGLSPFSRPEGEAPWGARDSPPSAVREQDPSARAVPEIAVLAEDPLAARDPDARQSYDEGLPILRPKPLVVDDAFPRAAAKLRQILGRASAWFTGLSQRVGRVTRRDRPAPSVRSGKSAVSLSPGLASPALKPASISELPILRLAPTDEPKEPADLYDEGDVYGRASPARAVWFWTRRFVLIAGLVAGGVWAALSWETWVPKATGLGRIVFAEIDARVQARYQAKRRERALIETVQQVPHLAPGTIDLVLSSSPTGILDPPEVFRLAWVAADQGVPALTAEEAQELTRLRGQLLETLTPAERELVHEYDLVRARRVTFTFEDQSALRLFARGARALPSRSLERLQALSGKAIAASLATEDAPRPRLQN